MFIQAKLSKSPLAKRSKCMKCSAKPTQAFIWADGRGIAWFCEKHSKNHGLSDVVRELDIEDGVMPTSHSDLKGRMVHKKRKSSMAERVAARFLASP